MRGKERSDRRKAGRRGKVDKKSSSPRFHDEPELVHVGGSLEVVDLLGPEGDLLSVAIPDPEVVEVGEEGRVNEADLREELQRS